ncbi:hypothetical protein VH86_20780 [Pantoea sp. BL1]|nr:hypothetical protein VH86_20780 [Pantoea sp. BL1]
MYNGLRGGKLWQSAHLGAPDKGNERNVLVVNPKGCAPPTPTNEGNKLNLKAEITWRHQAGRTDAARL